MKTNKYVRQLLIAVLLSSFTIILSGFSNTSDAKRAEAYYQQGVAAYQNKEWRDAIYYFQQSYEYMSHSLTSYFICCCYFWLNDSKQGLRYAKRALSDRPYLKDPYQAIARDFKEYFEAKLNPQRVNGSGSGLITAELSGKMDGGYSSPDIEVPANKTLLSVRIVNREDAEVRFVLSKNETKWVGYHLKSGYYMDYNFEGQSSCFIKITTNGNTLSYRLSAGKQYKIIWDDDINMYDLRSF